MDLGSILFERLIDDDCLEPDCNWKICNLPHEVNFVPTCSSPVIEAPIPQPSMQAAGRRANQVDPAAGTEMSPPGSHHPDFSPLSDLI